LPITAASDSLAGPEQFAAGDFLQDRQVNSEKAIELEGTITAVLPGTMFRVALANDHMVLAHISGKMRKRFIRLTIGDRVKMEMSPYDTAKARIVYRL
jgi:translation initiation factor IF-1